MAGRASIVGAAETSVGKVRDHNEDSHFIDVERGIFAVCDGMGGHAAGEVASALAVKVLRDRWGSDDTQRVGERWLEEGTPDARKAMLRQIQADVVAAHDAIVGEAQRDKTKSGMGTTLVGALVVGGDIVFAQCGDSRAYLVRDGIAMQLTEDHTLLARLLAAGVDVDTSAEGARFKSMLTNALGIGHECKAATFVVPVADGDRFLLCSDGITEYVQEAEIGEVLTTAPSPARAAQRLVEMALQRGGGDNATALVVKVVESGETTRPVDLLQRENKAINACPLWAKVSPQGRLRALRIALPRDYAQGDKLPAQTLGDRVAWILVDGEVEQNGFLRGPGSLLYPEALLADRPLPDKDGLCIAESEIRGLALRSDDFREVCEDDPELGEQLLEALANEIAARSRVRHTGRMIVQVDADDRGATDPGQDEVASAPTIPPGQVTSSETALPPPEDATTPTNLARALAPTIPPPSPVARTTTPPQGIGRTPTPPQGRPVTAPPMIARIPIVRVPPKPTDEELAPGPTQPQIAAPQPADASANPNRMHPRGSTPPAERLIVPQAEIADAEAQLDRALADLTIDRTNLADDGDVAPPSRPVVPPRPETEEPEIVVEAGDPTAPVATRGKSLGDHSDVEISILADEPPDERAADAEERVVELEVEEPLNEVPVAAAADDEPSSPEIIVIHPGAIEPAPAPRQRAKRQTDAPD